MGLTRPHPRYLVYYPENCAKAAQINNCPQRTLLIISEWRRCSPPALYAHIISLDNVPSGASASSSLYQPSGSTAVALQMMTTQKDRRGDGDSASIIRMITQNEILYLRNHRIPHVVT
ncbi:hypothetical protein Hypma_016025 [Hypsizygus marmoreus]|uniref:Uncharacterized protein n=1 Tax=Hypsizygus marmoreus TaxID=39966 RepID=A0A369K5G2_HYPMA|nr:hypothetical protein Hypma_016015 [Hypsizygus marmoreus]RDB29138.1 hypothetical protein Hypma_016025 [Hypsizygus marmoreus]